MFAGMEAGGQTQPWILHFCSHLSCSARSSGLGSASMTMAESRETSSSQFSSFDSPLPAFFELSSSPLFNQPSPQGNPATPCVEILLNPAPSNGCLFGQTSLILLSHSSLISLTVSALLGMGDVVLMSCGQTVVLLRAREEDASLW
ncbi:hypothetical protein VTI74DRAFT_11102 [Chaetomium olivicolor]